VWKSNKTKIVSRLHDTIQPAGFFFHKLSLDVFFSRDINTQFVKLLWVLEKVGQRLAWPEGIDHEEV